MITFLNYTRVNNIFKFLSLTGLETLDLYGPLYCAKMKGEFVIDSGPGLPVNPKESRLINIQNEIESRFQRRCVRSKIWFTSYESLDRFMKTHQTMLLTSASGLLKLIKNKEKLFLIE